MHRIVIRRSVPLDFSTYLQSESQENLLVIWIQNSKSKYRTCRRTDVQHTKKALARNRCGIVTSPAQLSEASYAVRMAARCQIKSPSEPGLTAKYLRPNFLKPARNCRLIRPEVHQLSCHLQHLTAMRQEGHPCSRHSPTLLAGACCAAKKGTEACTNQRCARCISASYAEGLANPLHVRRALSTAICLANHCQRHLQCLR